MASQINTCSSCDNTWTGLSLCHCSLCHIHFGGLTSFDKHISRGKHLTPEAVGLVPTEKPFGLVWGRDYQDAS